MNTKFKYLITIFAGIVLLAIVIVPNLPKPKITLSDQIAIDKIISEQNADLPRKLGTIGWLNSVQFEDNSLVYHMSVNGDATIDTVYENNYSQFHKIYLYSIVTMNGQGNYGTILTRCLDAKDLNLKCVVTTPSKRRFEWTLSPSEIIAFMDSCKANPTEAMYSIIDMQVKLKKQQLPAVVDASGNVRTISINAISSATCNDGDILLDIQHTENDIEICYLTGEQEYSLSDIVNSVDDMQFLSALTDVLAQDDDVRELLNSLAISHSNLILHYEGVKTKRNVTIKIPYVLIRENCDVPQELLSIN
jgi:hypothetical protein